jgi:hypothetical protein
MQCKAKRRNGTDCRNHAILGGTVCNVHGGRLPNVRKAAAERLKELQHPAIERLEEALDADARTVTKRGEILTVGPDHANRIRAATVVLDRTGLGPTHTANVNVEAGERLLGLMRELDRPTVRVPNEAIGEILEG